MVDQELKTYLIAMEERIGARIEERIDASEKKLEERIGARIEERIDASEKKLEQRIESRLDESFTHWSRHILTEMGLRFDEVNQRLDRMDATLTNHGKQIAAGTRAIGGFTEWGQQSGSRLYPSAI
jgi:hypothetical protein